jgi:hypothetical protein
MNILSIAYSSISLAIILASITTIIVKQWSLKSSAVYYFLGLEVLIAIWIIAGILQIIFSNPGDTQLSLIFSIIGVIANGLAMICSVLFASSLSGLIPLKQVALYIVFLLFGGVFGITLSSDVFYVQYNPTLDFSGSKSNTMWIICLAGGVVIAGTFFLWHLIRQRSIVDTKHKRSTSFMIAGVIVAFYASILVYALRLLSPGLQKAFLHSELITTSIGTALITVGMIIGGKTALYGSSQVISINIYNEHGLNLYQGFFKTAHKINEHLVSGVATAIAAFATEIIGEEVFPREIDLGEYSLILEKPGKFAGFIACKYPSTQIQQGLKRVMANYQPGMEFDEISKMIDNYLPYGAPQRDPGAPAYRRIVD